jgi:hypothetical protein
VWERVREGYRAPAPRTAIPVGGESVTAALNLGVHLMWRAGRASDHASWLDTAGWALAALTLLGVLVHGLARVIVSRRKP